MDNPRFIPLFAKTAAGLRVVELKKRMAFQWGHTCLGNITSFESSSWFVVAPSAFAASRAAAP